MYLQRIGRCLPLFLAAIFLDVVGFIVLFVGIFANVKINGQFYGDFLIYSGSITIFASLAAWLMWYIGNIEVEVAVDGEDEHGSSYSNSFEQMARKLSKRIAKSIKSNGSCANGPVDVEDHDKQVDTPAPKASRVTWGKSNAYMNEGYEESEHSLPPESNDKCNDLTSQDESVSTLTE